MRFYIPLLILIIASAALVFSYIHQPAVVTSLTPETTETEPTPLPPLEERVGQLFMVGHWSNTPLASTTALITDLHAGGIILMDAPTPATSIETWTTTWQTTSATPLLIAIDQEGGSVSRLKGNEYVQTAQPTIVDTDTAYSTAYARGTALHTLGITVNLAPVLDTSVNPQSFLYNRVFRDPLMIAPLGDAMLRGYRDSGIVGAPKHYPGHPDTSDDSHLTLPVITGTTADYQEHTLQFANTIDLGHVDILMTAHVLVPALDPTYPATLSPAILNDLRTRIGYQGVVMTDDLIMKALANTWSSDEAAVQALSAGADLLLFAAEPEKARSAYEAVLAAVQSGTLSEARINEAYGRLMKLKGL